MAEDRDIVSNMNARYALEPLDTLLFRDGRSFEQSDEGLTEATSMFPPFPSVVAGAVRAQLAHNMGWSGRGKWNSTLTDQLGSGPFNATPLRVGPPIILVANPSPDIGPFAAANYLPYFPCPAVLHGRLDPEMARQYGLLELTQLRPARQVDQRTFWKKISRFWSRTEQHKDRIATDLSLDEGQSLCAPNPDGFEALDEWLISDTGLKDFLAGGIPNTQYLKHTGLLVTRQNRAGLQRNYAAHAAESGMLYNASYVRLRQDRVWQGSKVGQVTLGVAVDQSALTKPIRMIPSATIVPLGSMGRVASCSAIETSLDLAQLSVKAVAIKPTSDCYLHYMIVLISPALPHTSPRGPGRGLNLPKGHEVVSAVIPKPIAFSGWDASTGGPAPMRRYVAPGSTWYMRFKGKVNNLQEQFDELLLNGISAEGSSVGFGAVQHCAMFQPIVK